MTRALLALLLLVPLAELPGTGFDILRLPLALALGAALLASGPVSLPGRAGLALLAFVGVQALSLAVSPDPGAGLAALLAAATSLAAYAGARERRIPWEAAALAAAVLAAAAFARPASLLGNSNYAGAFAAMLLPALAAGPRSPLAWGGAAAAAALLALSGSRGGAVGAAAGCAVAAALLWREGRRRDAAVLACALGLAGAAALALAPGKALSGDTLTVRAGIWKGALRLGADRPLLGAGAGGFGVLFPPYRSETEARITQRNEGRGFPEVDNAHSSWVQAFADAGVPGALAWLALAVATALLARRAGPGSAGWAGAAVAFLAAGLFNTLTNQVAHALLFGAALGFLEEGDRRPLPGAARGTAAALLALGALWAAARVGPDRAYTRVEALATPAAREAVLRSSDGWRFKFRLGEELSRQGRHREAAGAYRDVLERRPFHAVSLNNLAVALLRSGAPRAEAEAVLLRALEVAPHYYMTRFNLGLLKAELGDRAEARRQFERAAGLNETHGSSRYEIGGTFVAEGDIPGALPHLRRARELGVDVAAALRRDHPAKAEDPRLAEFR